MARGWESKSVESQIEAAEERQRLSQVHRVSVEQAERERQRESLQLSRVRVLRDLEASTHPRYQENLRAALRHLDEKLAELG
jgi:hypothetical protein